MSTHWINGFDGVSIQTMRVFGCCAHRVEVRHVDEGRAHRPLGEQVFQHIGRAVIDILGRDDMVPGLQALEDRRHRGEARAERGAGCATFERSQRSLQTIAIRVVIARIQESVWIAAIGVALERGRQVNGLGNRASRRIHAVAGMHRESFESVGL